MKTSIVPAQITTVEDKIAGNLTFNQILLLIVPLLLGTIVYVLLPPRVHLNLIKFFIICLLFIVFGFLAVRFRGRTIADWLVIFLRFNLRPHLYVFTKNDITTRDIMISGKISKATEAKKESQSLVKSTPWRNEQDQLILDQFLKNPSLSVRIELDKKGGMDVSLDTIKN